MTDIARIAAGLPETQPNVAAIARGHERMFPVLHDYRRKNDEPRKIPWTVIAPHEAQAQNNHYQTLERLAERGGLSWCEMLAVLEDRKYQRMDTDEAKERVLELVQAHLRSNQDEQ